MTCLIDSANLNDVALVKFLPTLLGCDVNWVVSPHLSSHLTLTQSISVMMCRRGQIPTSVGFAITCCLLHLT